MNVEIIHNGTARTQLYGVAIGISIDRIRSMLAEQLVPLLVELCHGIDFRSDARAEMDKRFESLRGYGRLPQGRENRNRALSDDQIVATLLGLATSRPNWAGHAATITGKLKPVGCIPGALGRASDITAALCNILTDPAVRASIVCVRISISESGTNSRGLAVITYEIGGARHDQAFVRDEAVSLLVRGATFDADFRHAPVSCELVFNRYFFERLAREIKQARAFPSPMIGDGSEYYKEDAERARMERLGVTPSSRFLNIGVDTQVTWPKTEMMVEFDRYKLVLMPKTKDNVQSIHVDLHASCLNDEEAMTVINRFLSLLTWCDDQFAVAQDGWSGNTVPVAVPKRDLAFATAYDWVFSREIPQSEEVRRALALYREARNAEQNFMISYAVLNYYKIIEIQHSGKKAIGSREWIKSNLPVIHGDPANREEIDAFLGVCGAEEPQEYLYVACRCAVAHSGSTPTSDPDDLAELRRLHNVAGIMRLLARHFISADLGFSDSSVEDDYS